MAISKYNFAVTGIAIASVWFGVTAYMTIPMVRDANLALKKENEALLQSYERANRDFFELAKINAKITDQHQNMMFKLDKMMGRESVVLAKPGLVELKVQKSFELFEKEMACLTGKLSECPSRLSDVRPLKPE